MNLFTDSLPAIAIGMEPPEDGLLDKAPRDPNEGILNKEFMTKLFGMGGIIAICTMAAFHIGLNQGDEMLASTMAFATLTIGQLGAIIILALIPTVIIQYGKMKNNNQ